jgi:hypothetical protein
VRRDTYKDATAIPSPPQIRDYVSAATLAPHDGSPIIALSAYKPQFHIKAQDTLYTEILKWIQTEIISKYPAVTTIMGGDLQATPSSGEIRSYHEPINQFCQESGLKHITPKDIHTYIPAKNINRPLATKTPNHKHTLPEHTHSHHHPHPGLRRPQDPHTRPSTNRGHQHS